MSEEFHRKARITARFAISGTDEKYINEIVDMITTEGGHFAYQEIEQKVRTLFISHIKLLRMLVNFDSIGFDTAVNLVMEMFYEFWDGYKPEKEPS